MKQIKKQIIKYLFLKEDFIKIQFFQYYKGLQYTWFLKDTQQESDIYDQLGVSYYYLGKIQTSEIYHNISTVGESESIYSAQRQFSELLIKNHLKKSEWTWQGFSRQTFRYLSLPIINIFEKEEEWNIKDIKKEQGIGSEITCDQFKTMTYRNCDGKSIIQSILSDEEFKCEMKSPQLFRMQKIKGGREGLAKEFTEQKKDYIKKRILKPQILIDHQLNRNKQDQKALNLLSKFQQNQKMSIHKASLDQKIDIMVKDKDDYLTAIERVQFSISNKLTRKQNNQQIFLSHNNQQTQQQLDLNGVNKKQILRYKQLISDIIALSIMEKLNYSTNHIQILQA